MINNIIKIKKKFFLNKNFYNLIIKIGKQKNKFLKNKFLIINCVINTWVKIIFNYYYFFFGYSNSIFLSGILKILFKIINKNVKKNILILLNFDFLLILKIKKKITNFKKESINIVINYINNVINYN
ncbi:SufE family protein [Candidatus Carsonella ruddii]|uniref:SufE family protein n=1 Tax=Carsonella ruddii TaxID=114186 RepID=UPI003D4CBA77